MRTQKGHHNNYKIILTELGSNPFRRIEAVFALMFVIPLLAAFYLITKEELFPKIFLGDNGTIMALGIVIAVTGFLYAYLIVRDLVARLLTYAQERKLADDEKTEVMLAVAHDFKNPLTVIKLAFDNLLEGIGGTLNNSQSGIVKICLSNIEKLFRFVEDILKASESYFFRRFIAREQVDLVSIVKNEVDNTALLARKSNLDLRYWPPSGEVSLWGDKDKLSRVTANLITNAIKFTPQGGIVDVELSSDENAVTFSVTNTGKGLKPDEVARLFKKYERLEEHSEIEGSGLGLSIVKDIIDLHNGHITVRSELGKDTEFKVILPRDLRKKAEAAR